MAVPHLPRSRGGFVENAGDPTTRGSAMLREYREFLFRGNLLDLATAFILGVAFSAVVQALAEDVVMGTVTAFLDLETVAEMRLGPVLVGTFVAALLSFVIVATVLFFILRAAARFRRADEVVTPDTDEVLLLREIRDLLSAREGQ